MAALYKVIAWNESEKFPKVFTTDFYIDQPKDSMPRQKIASFFMKQCGVTRDLVRIAEKKNGLFVRCGEGRSHVVYALRFKESEDEEVSDKGIYSL